jgi:hypothetical protein
MVRKAKARKAKRVSRTRRVVQSQPADIFEIEPPKGKQYQWVAVSVLGQKQNINTQIKGWRPVPRARHRKRFPGKGGHIILEGLQLFERRKPKDECCFTLKVCFRDYCCQRMALSI